MERTRSSELADAIYASVFNILSEREVVSIPFSGGLDSSTIAYVAKKFEDKTGKKRYITLYTAGVEGCYDFENAKSAADLLSLPLIKIEIEEKDIEDCLGRVVKIIGSGNPVHVSIALPLYFVSKHAKKGALILTGQGADELFGGYARYLNVPSEKLNEVLDDDYENLMSEGIKRDKAIAEFFGLRIAFPYLDENIVRIAKRTEPQEKIKQVSGKKIRKYILRQAAIFLDLPEKIAMREKKAAQYGSGVMNLIKKMAKEKGLALKEFINYAREKSEL